MISYLGLTFLADAALLLLALPPLLPLDAIPLAFLCPPDDVILVKWGWGWGWVGRLNQHDGIVRPAQAITRFQTIATPR